MSQGGQKLYKAFGMCRSGGKLVNLVFLKVLLDSMKLFSLIHSVLSMMSAWQSAPCQNISKSQKRTFAPLLTILQPFDLYYQELEVCIHEKKEEVSVLLHQTIKQWPNCDIAELRTGK